MKYIGRLNSTNHACEQSQYLKWQNPRSCNLLSLLLKLPRPPMNKTRIGLPLSDIAFLIVVIENQ